MASRTGLVYSQDMTGHKNIWDSNFPEKPERITDPYRRCSELGLVDRCIQMKAESCRDETVLLGHSEALLEKLKCTVSFSEEALKTVSQEYDSVYFNNETYACSRLALGGTVSLIEDIVDQKITNGMALVRPPGHHAMRDKFCGFSFFNNIGIAAKHAVCNLGLQRVLIVDWDVHHGQATQYMFYDDPRVLYFSIHRYENGQFWPNLRESDYDYIGDGEGESYNINVPLNQIGMADSDYMAIFQQILMPVAYEFSPDVVLISAGYDCALGDYKGEMKVSPAVFAHFTHMLSGLAEGRVCVALEGGYCLKSLSEGVALTLRSLLGDPCPMLPEMEEPCYSVCESISNVIKVLRPYWKCFQYQGCVTGGEDAVLHVPAVNERHPRPNIEFSTDENCPDRYELVATQLDDLQQTMFERQLEDLIENTSLYTPPSRTCLACDSQSCINHFKVTNHGIYEECVVLQYDQVDYDHLRPDLLAVIESILTGQAQNGIVVTRKQQPVDWGLPSTISYCQDKWNIQRLMIVDMNASKKETSQQFPEDQRFLQINFTVGECVGQDILPKLEPLGRKWNVPVIFENDWTDADLVAAFQQVVLPIGYAFAPELIVMRISESSEKAMPHLLHIVSALANGRLAVIAEEGLADQDSITACMSALLGHPLPLIPPCQPTHNGVNAICRVLSSQKQNWNCLKFKDACRRIIPD